MGHRGEVDGNRRTTESGGVAGQCVCHSLVDDRLECGKDALAVGLTDDGEPQTGGY